MAEEKDYIEIKIPDQEPEASTQKESTTQQKKEEKNNPSKKKTAKKKSATKKTKKTPTTKHAKKKATPKDDNNWLWVALIIIGLAVIGTIVYISVQQPTTQEPADTTEDEIVALVNEQPIYQTQVNDIYTRLPAYLQTDDQREVILEQLIEQEVLYQEAIRQNILVTQADLDDFVEELKIFFSIDDAQLEETLRVQEMTREEFDKSNRRQIAITKLLNATVYSSIDITEEEIQQYYDDNQDQFAQPEASIVQHILIVPEDDNETDNETLARAEAIIDMLDDDNTNFCALVDEYSADPGSECGEYAVSGNGQYVPEFEQAALELNIGELAVVKTMYGHHIMLKTAKQKAGITPLEQVQNKIRNTLMTERANEAVREYIKGLQEAATIDIFEDTQEDAMANEDAAMDDDVTTANDETSINKDNAMAQKDPASKEGVGTSVTITDGCLADATIYGVYWSPDVEKQQNELEEYGVTYVECDPANGNIPDTCASISVYPTVELGGEYYEGFQTVNALSAHC